LPDSKILPRAQESELLDRRIAENIRGQQKDLVQWIFERLEVQAGWQVLELCSGTGSQTLRLLELVGASGGVTALDVAGEALEKLRDKLDAAMSRRLTTVAAPMEDFPQALAQLPLKPPAFDLIFCAYGLYYSRDPKETLEEALRWLKPGGRMAIVGPYRANNGPLFGFLGELGAEIPPPVIYASRDFMEAAVIPWGLGHFRKITVHTMVNPVVWDKPESLITYWQNSTFYDEARLLPVEQRLAEYFQVHRHFINEKWVMMVEMQND
jgi:ubiquinone/menaquinone biosynthesis C-methylase UbiE